MSNLELLVFVAFAALAVCTEVDDAEQKKRGVGKGTSLNSITTGAQKQDYTYNIYTQNPNSQTGHSGSYQTQLPNSFYPNQGNQYYSSSNTQPEANSYQAQQQHQLNLSHQPSSTQFEPLNFVPNPGYQSKYQLVQSKQPGNIRLAILQQPNGYPTAPIVPYAPSLFPQNSGNPHQNSFSSISPGHYNVAANYQPFSGSYLSQPSTMLLFAQPTASMYNNLLYPNPIQSLYNYYPTNAQKYVPYAASGSNEYEKNQGVSQSVPKEENDVTHTSEYASPSDSYKNAYTASRNSYSKLT